MNHWQQNKVTNKFILIHNGFDYSEFNQSSSTLRKELNIADDVIIVGMIGRINNIKGQDYFLQIAGKLKAKKYSLAFIIVGDTVTGYEKKMDELKLIAAKENISTDVYFTGLRTDIGNVLNAFDIFVLPSILPDSFPTVVLEAMAAAKPVIATKQGGAVEMIKENETGMFIPLNNIDEAANIIEKLIQDKTIRMQMGEAGKQRVNEHFSLQQFQQAMIKAIQ
jgi:glycosyltransferase involved in cell wall biosynthesis